MLVEYTLRHGLCDMLDIRGLFQMGNLACHFLITDGFRMWMQSNFSTIVQVPRRTSQETIDVFTTSNMLDTKAGTFSNSKRQIYFNQNKCWYIFDTVCYYVERNEKLYYCTLFAMYTSFPLLIVGFILKRWVWCFRACTFFMCVGMWTHIQVLMPCAACLSLKSTAAHEMGHALGFTHPSEGVDLLRNTLANATALLYNNSIMHSTMVSRTYDACLDAYDKEILASVSSVDDDCVDDIHRLHYDLMVTYSALMILVGSTVASILSSFAVDFVFAFQKKIEEVVGETPNLVF